jgi:hypothetical protein
MSRLLCSLAVVAACADSESQALDAILAADPHMPDYGDGKADSPSTDQLVAMYCPGVTYAAGVPTYKGLAGTFQRVTPPAPGEPLRMKLVTTRDDPDAEGSFSGLETSETGLPAAFAGTFFAITDNPAIGAALGLDTDGDDQVDEVHFVLGVRRSFGKVTRLCLTGNETPFLMTRSLL